MAKNISWDFYPDWAKVSALDHAPAPANEDRYCKKSFTRASFTNMD